jgi:hypothetical protein
MPYEFRQWEEELEPKPSSGRFGGPPRKFTGVGVLDPPGPPAGHRAALPTSFLLGLLGVAGLGLFLYFLLFAR